MSLVYIMTTLKFVLKKILIISYYDENLGYQDKKFEVI